MSELQNAADPARGPGPWFIAARPGACSDCGESFEEGDTIRADGWGSWEGRECQDGHDDAADLREPYVGTSNEEMGL